MLGLAFTTVTAVTNPTIKLNNGVIMPQMAAGTWLYDNATATSSVNLGECPIRDES